MGILTTTTKITGGQAAGFPDGFQLMGSPDALTPAGSTIADATAITKALSVVTGADGTKGVILPTASPGGPAYMVYSATATNGLKIYPQSGQTINGGSASTEVAIEGKTLAIFVATSTTNWAAIYTAN